MLSVFISTFLMVVYHSEGKTEIIDAVTCASWRHFFLDVALNGTSTCKPCTRKCKPGYRRVAHCTRVTDTMCEKCWKGSYSTENSNHCRDCKHCWPRSDRFKPSRTCTTSEKAQCGLSCPNGMHLRHRKCVSCDDCPAGTYMTSRCSWTKNTLCRVCPPGTFSALSNNRLPYCNTCTDCRYGEEVTSACNVTHDTRCGDCRPGMFRMESTSECALCSPCYSDEAGNVTNIVEECRQRNPDQSRICMPSVEPWVFIRGNHTDDNYTEEKRREPIRKARLFEGDAFGMTVFVMACVVLVLIVTGFLVFSGLFMYKRRRVWCLRRYANVKQHKHTEYVVQADLITRWLEDVKQLQQSRPIVRSSTEPFPLPHKGIPVASEDVGQARSFPENFEICDSYNERITWHIGNSLSDCSDIFSVSATGSTSGSKHVS